MPRESSAPWTRYAERRKVRSYLAAAIEEDPQKDPLDPIPPGEDLGRPYE